jgi:hypothetical protein
MTTGIIAYCFVIGYSQDSIAPAKKFDTYIGVQANELINQIINLNNSNTTIPNPYLLNFSINLHKTGWGIEAGIGANITTSKDVNAPVLNETDVNNTFFRIGIGRTMMVTKKLQVGYYLDFKMDNQVDKSISGTINVISTQESDSTIATTTTKGVGIGFGPKFQLGFYLTRRLMLGTEISYYYTTTKLKQNSNTTNYITNSFGPNSTSIINSNFETDGSSFNITFPTALFLIFKF